MTTNVGGHELSWDLRLKAYSLKLGTNRGTTRSSKRSQFESSLDEEFEALNWTSDKTFDHRSSRENRDQAATCVGTAPLEGLLETT